MKGTPPPHPPYIPAFFILIHHPQFLQKGTADQNGNLICISYINSSLSERPFGCISCPSPSSSSTTGLEEQPQPVGPLNIIPLFFPLSICDEGLETGDGRQFPVTRRGEGYPPHPSADRPSLWWLLSSIRAAVRETVVIRCDLRLIWTCNHSDSGVPQGL